MTTDWDSSLGGHSDGKWNFGPFAFSSSGEATSDSFSSNQDIDFAEDSFTPRTGNLGSSFGSFDDSFRGPTILPFHPRWRPSFPGRSTSRQFSVQKMLRRSIIGVMHPDATRSACVQFAENYSSVAAC